MMQSSVTRLEITSPVKGWVEKAAVKGECQHFWQEENWEIRNRNNGMPPCFPRLTLLITVFRDLSARLPPVHPGFSGELMISSRSGSWEAIQGCPIRRKR